MNKDIVNSSQRTLEIPSNLLQKVQRDIDLWSFVAGAILMLSLLAIGVEIGGKTESSIFQEYYSPIFVTLFISVSSGHYLGLAFTTDSDNLTSAYIGAFAVLWFASLTVTELSPLSFALAGITFGIVLAYQRGIVANHKRIKKLMEIFGKGIAPSGIFLMAFIEYLLPFVLSLDIVSEVTSYANNNPAVFVPILVILLIIERTIKHATENQTENKNIP
ncbi:hypothetical protein [Natrinema salifodinae]|uniref:Uncharacterized protein n=1 Tax=Natrinema salifodinae TaxID=1202768 RepID=A0A1I0QCP3_9EURY|nr:hypothetical protein [Natrinema salifodinae]SEW24812.1 hypothetical protein SAMN05216285_3389 [Natrinema salifodinae]